MKFLRRLFDHEYKELKKFTVQADKIIALEEDYAKDQITMKEYVDPFTGNQTK